MAAASISASLHRLLAEVSALANRLKGGTSAQPQLSGLAPSTRAIGRLLLDNGPQTVPTIARARQTSRQNIQIAVNRLKKAGYVGLVTNPVHKRSVLGRLTEQGQRALTGAEEEDERSFVSLFGQISEAELASATAMLRRLRSELFGAARQFEPPRPRFERTKTEGESLKRAARKGTDWPVPHTNFPKEIGRAHV